MRWMSFCGLGWRKAEWTCHVLHQGLTAFIERSVVCGGRADELWGTQALSCACPSRLQLWVQPTEGRLEKSTSKSWPGTKKELLKPGNFHLWSFPLGQEMLKSYEEKNIPQVKMRSRRGDGSNKSLSVSLQEATSKRDPAHLRLHLGPGGGQTWRIWKPQAAKLNSKGCATHRRWLLEPS